MTRTTRRADDLNVRIKETDRALGDNDDNPEGERDPTSTVHAVVEQDRWHYYHVSTP